jgi:hypothetical protein
MLINARASRALLRHLAVGLALVLSCGPVTLGQSRRSAETPRPAPSAGHQQMLAWLKQIGDETPDNHPFLGDATARRLRAELASLSPAAPPPDRWLLHTQLGQAELQLGNVLESVDQFTKARELVTAAGTQMDLSPWIASTLFQLGVAYLRLGETQNCTLHHTANSCILPLRGDAIHADQRPARQAIAAFTDGLAVSPGITSVSLSLRWLLNLAYMAVDGYPDQVPEQYRLSPEAYDSGERFPRFINIAPRLGLDTFNLAGGAIGDDFDNDGYLDIVASTQDTRGQIRFFRNNQDGTFSERSEEAGLTGLFGGLNLVQADYDNDGDVDVLVLRGGWLAEHGRHPNSLLRNNGNGTFTDATIDAGLAGVHYPTQTASWGDYDNDGDVDLYIGNESSAAISAPGQLFRNNGNGTFTDVAAQAGVENQRYAKGVVWGDYDGDRRPDLYVSNRAGPNRLYRNNGDGTFTDVAPQLGVERPIESFPVWFWDVDNDGVLDLYVSAYAAGIDHLAASALRLPPEIELARLYRGNGRGGFEEVSAQYNLGRPNAPMGANVGDLDNDGYLDFYLGTGYPAIHNIMPNVMYRNQNGRRFADVTYAGGFGHLQKGHAVIFADFDHDGDQDVFEQMGGAYPVDGFRNVLYESPGFGNHWITIKLVGVRSNRSAIGARIRAEIVEDGERRSVYRHVNSGGSFGANPLRQTIGLGKASRVEVLEIFWPTTGVTQTFTNVAADRLLQIVEGERSYETVRVKRLRFGGG